MFPHLSLSIIDDIKGERQIRCVIKSRFHNRLSVDRINNCKGSHQHFFRSFGFILGAKYIHYILTFLLTKYYILYVIFLCLSASMHLKNVREKRKWDSIHVQCADLCLSKSISFRCK